VEVDERLRLTISYEEPDEEGWIVASVVEVPGALSQGRTRDEARANVIDALRLMLSPDDDDPHVAQGQSEPLELILAG
jgi:predicted RNase H-like HicB family nuclease